MITKLTNLTKAKKEIVELENWFKKYDIQVIQYQRDLRTHGVSTIDINTLDAEAYEKAAKIKELRKSILELESLFKSHFANLNK
jgi:hypothetical protein